MKAILLGSIGTVADTSHMQLAAFNQAFKKHDLSWIWSPDEYSKMLKVSGGANRIQQYANSMGCLLYTSPSPRDPKTSRMPSSA